MSYTPSGGTFAVIKTVTVDNGKPSLVSNSPEPGLIVKGNTDITFSADITDSISGYDAKFTTGTPERGIKGDLSNADLLNDGTGSIGARSFGPTDANHITKEGGVRLVVAGNVVALAEGDFTKIDGGWRVSKTINSSSLQSISTNVPWYFETRDRANNVQRTSGSVSGTAGTGSTGGVIVDAKFAGNLNANTFLRTNVRVSKKDPSNNTVTSNAQPVTLFAGASGTFTIPNTLGADATLGGTAGDADDLLFDDAVADRYSDSDGNGTTDPAVDAVIPATDGYQCRVDERDTINLGAITGTPSSLVPQTIMLEIKGAPDGAGPDGSGATVSGPAAEALQVTACDPAPKNSYEILGTNPDHHRQRRA